MGALFFSSYSIYFVQGQVWTEALPWSLLPSHLPLKAVVSAGRRNLKKKKKWLPLRDHPFAVHSGISSFKIVHKGDYHEAGIHELVDNLFSNLENSNGGGCRSQLRPPRERTVPVAFLQAAEQKGTWLTQARGH